MFYVNACTKDILERNITDNKIEKFGNIIHTVRFKGGKYVRDVQTARDVKIGKIMTHATQILDAEVGQLQDTDIQEQYGSHDIGCFSLSTQALLSI